MENKSNIKIKPTIEWMVKKYNEANSLYFGGKLGPCDFELFVSGKGSQGRTLGFFTCLGEKIKIERSTRRMYQEEYFGGKTYINSSNFADIFKPLIRLNANYSATEDAWFNTLVHEMCHYYTYMEGFCPKQAHGPEFKRICTLVSLNSNGKIIIQRLATAEEMTDFELNDEMKQKNEKRRQAKVNKLTAIFVFKGDNIQLILTSNESLIWSIIDTNRIENPLNQIILSKDSRLIEKLFNMGYNRDLRTYRYWPISRDLWETLIDFKMEEAPKKRPTKVFKLYEENIKYIVENILKELIDNDEDSIEFNPNIPLSQMSPFEY